MPKINILPAKVYNRIAAGEVVDRPYSVVKELVENAIDAGATEIEIYIEQGGKQLIRVVDNGCGIAREDLHSAFLPHATSKISKAEDLESIVTLGFRGEAVASISAVSKMTITSKTKDGKCYALRSNGGELGQIEEVAGRDGTDVAVEMLFFNTPVRLGFLKTDKGEETDITNFISRFILNRPEIAFIYYVNGKKVLQSFGGGVEEALVGIYGASTLSQCYEINAVKHGIKIRGYIGNQNFFKPNKTYQSVFLNGRYIQNVTISSAVSNAYSSYMMKRQYPFYVLYVDVPTEIVDVNVHPNKADVRFADNKIIYGSIYSVISAVLDGQSKAMEYVVKTPSNSAYHEEGIQETPIAPLRESLSLGVQGVLNTQTSSNTQSATSKKEEKPTKVKKEVSSELPQRKTFFGITTLTYEDAQKEIEESAPLFTAKKQGKELPFAEVGIGTESKKEPLKGFVSLDELDEYVPSEEKAGTRRKSKGKTEDLQKKFPDLYFKRNEIWSNDSSVEEVRKNVEAYDQFAENKRFLEELDKKNGQNRIDVTSCVYVGKLFNTYLLYECNDDAYVIDQHAAHERLIYNRLRTKMDNREVIKQPMLVPYQLIVNIFEKSFLLEKLSEIRALGFDIEEREEQVFEITAIPTDLKNINLTSFFNEILSDMEGYRAIRLTELLKDKLATEACKAAVKGGMDLTKEEIDALFALMDGDMGLKCPHGRPVVVKISKTELEKMFKRIL